MRRTRRHGIIAITIVGLAAAAVVVPGSVNAVETDMSISTTAIDFGQVNVGSSAQASVTLTNTGGDPFGPINIFGGAPPTAEFNASQNCQATTLPAGGSCNVNYSFSPGAAGTFNDTSSFTISETNSQADGEDFSVTLTGVGYDPNATTTTTSTTTTTTATTTTTTTPTQTTAASASPDDDDDEQPGTTTGAATTTTTTTLLERLPLTGVRTYVLRPALVVKVDNVDAEPQSGLNQADVVFEEIVEGRATRFAAVFNSMEADPVGPIRSGRTQDVNLLLSLNDPAIAYSGANAEVNNALQAAGFELLGEGTPGFFRRDDLPAPHNLYANLSELFPQLVSSGNAVPIFDYVEPGIEVTGTPVTFAEMTVGDYPVRWDWNAGRDVFLRSQLGSPHELTDGQASADTVVVLVLGYGTSPAGGGPEAQTLGTGRAVVYSDGLKVEGTWTRQNPTDPFSLEANGQPILLAPGRTWVELVDDSNNLTDG
jgi:DUF3048 family protein/ASPM-SPD-2-Hydin domain-containing protein